MSSVLNIQPGLEPATAPPSPDYYNGQQPQVPAGGRWGGNKHVRRGSRFLASSYGLIEMLIFGGALVAIAAPYWLGAPAVMPLKPMMLVLALLFLDAVALGSDAYAMTVHIKIDLFTDVVRDEILHYVSHRHRPTVARFVYLLGPKLPCRAHGKIVSKHYLKHKYVLFYVEAASYGVRRPSGSLQPACICGALSWRTIGTVQPCR